MNEMQIEWEATHTDAKRMYGWVRGISVGKLSGIELRSTLSQLAFEAAEEGNRSVLLTATPNGLTVRIEELRIEFFSALVDEGPLKVRAQFIESELAPFGIWDVHISQRDSPTAALAVATARVGA